MAELTAHEKYLLGEPLTPELAAVREGREPEPKPRPAAKERRYSSDTDRELTRPERLDLKEFWQMSGQKLYMRLAQKAIHLHEKRAISLSQENPLANRDEIANAWAYVKIFRRVVRDLDALVNNELDQLENEQ